MARGSKWLAFIRDFCRGACCDTESTCTAVRTVYSRDITSGRVIERVKRSRGRNWWRNRRDLEACMLLIINCSESVVETMLRGS